MTGGTKFDSDPVLKPKIGLVPLRAMWEIAKVMSFGAKKYTAHNWRAGFKYSRLYDAAMRHIIQFTQGEDTDPDSGLHHLAHAGCCIAMLLEMTMDRKDLDDRYKETKYLPWVEDAGEDNGKTKKTSSRRTEVRFRRSQENRSTEDSQESSKSST